MLSKFLNKSWTDFNGLTELLLTFYTPLNSILQANSDSSLLSVFHILFYRLEKFHELVHVLRKIRTYGKPDFFCLGG